jgi:hypothetical protein
MLQRDIPSPALWQLDDTGYATDRIDCELARRDGPDYVWNRIRDRLVAALFDNIRHRRRRFPTLSESGSGELK